MILFCNLEDFEEESSGKREYKEVENLLRAIGRDDADAFRRLYGMHAKSVYAYALSILKNHYDAEEVMQDTFLKIRSAAHLYRPMGKPMAWILKIARNYCLMRIRKDERMSDNEFEQIENSHLLSYQMDAEDRLVLKGALELLSEEERNIILLHAVTGWKHREIAENIGMPVSTVLSKYNRGLKKLRDFLEEKEGTGNER